MPSIIQAGNAASTGLVTTGATDGILELRSGTATGGTVAVTINAKRRKAYSFIWRQNKVMWLLLDYARYV